MVPEEDVKVFLTDVMDVVGGTADRGGTHGVDADRLKRFVEQGKLWVEWRGKAAAESRECSVRSNRRR